MMLRKIAMLLAIAALAAGCTSTRPVTLTYARPSSLNPTQGLPVVSGVAVTDVRGNGANWIGAIRGGYGNPLKVLETEKPVRDVVADLIVEGLEARGLSAPGKGSYRLDITLRALNSSQMARREAHVDLTAQLVSTSTGAAIFTRDVKVDRVNGSILSLNTGIMANPEELRALANEALQAAIDQLLDDPGLRAAMK